MYVLIAKIVRISHAIYLHHLYRIFKITYHFLAF